MRNRHELVGWISQHGGVAHSNDVRAAGFSMHGMRTAVDMGAVRRIRRSWLAVPECERALFRAAEVGGRVTCLSQAERLSLWVPDTEHLHIAVPGNSSRVSGEGLSLHWAQGPAPVVSSALVDPILNVLFHVARCVPSADAMAVWESAIRKGLVSADVLRRVRWRSEAARRIADVASSLSDSGIETRFLLVIRPLGLELRQQVWLDGHPVDFLIGEKLVVQVDGFAHHRAADRRRDLRADARLQLLGFTVVRFDFQQVLFDPGYVTDIVSTAVAQHLHR